MPLTNFGLRRIYIKAFIDHIIRKTLISDYLAKNLSNNITQSINLDLNIIGAKMVITVEFK